MGCVNQPTAAVSSADNNPAVGSGPHVFHVGLAPHRAADGLLHGSFQALNADGYAEATVSLVGQKIERYFALHYVDVRWFLTLARRAMGGAL